MAASQDECIAAYPKSQVCNDRIFARLLAWASYVTALPMPPTDVAPDTQWVRERIMAERVPAMSMMWVPQISPYTLEVPNVANNVRSMLNQWNTEVTETQLSADVDAAMAVVMPKFANNVITDYDVALWCDKYGYPRPSNLNVPLPPAPPPEVTPP